MYVDQMFKRFQGKFDKASAMGFSLLFALVAVGIILLVVHMRKHRTNQKPALSHVASTAESTIM